MIELHNYKIDENRIVMATTDEFISEEDADYNICLYMTDKQIEINAPTILHYESEEERDADFEKIYPCTYGVKMTG